MIITPLGHTEFLVDIANHEGENVRILVDTWLSDYAVGDMMERSVRVRLDPEKLKTLDVIYISHSHCDHFDPYTLVEIYKHSSPLLLLPFTLQYLEPLLREYIPGIKIYFLSNHERYEYLGIGFTGHMWQNAEITNEDDVMMIAISSDRELLFAEIDTVPESYDEQVQKSLYRVFTEKEYDTRAYIASRNCLEGQIPYYDVPENKRKPFREKYIADQKEDMLAEYEKYDYEEYADFPNLFTLSGFVRGYIGQGIRYPSEMSESLASLQIFPLDELVSIESDYAKNAGYDFPQKALLPGRQYRLEEGSIEQGRKECPIGELMKNEEGKNPTNSFVPQDDGNMRLFVSGPLFPRALSDDEITRGKAKILEILNTRFLPYWSASPVASFRDAIIKNDGTYRIGCKVSVISTESSASVTTTRDPAQKSRNSEQDFSLRSASLEMTEQRDSSVSLRNDKTQEKLVFEYSTAGYGFVEVSYEEGMKTDEDYWFSDVLDFFEGRQEMYSSFWHRLDPKRVYRLWTCLGATYMNHDLVEKKYRLHFERAKQGKTAEGFVGEVLQNIKNQEPFLKSKI